MKTQHTTKCPPDAAHYLAHNAELLEITIQKAEQSKNFDFNENREINNRECCVHVHVLNHMITMEP